MALKKFWYHYLYRVQYICSREQERFTPCILGTRNALWIKTNLHVTYKHNHSQIIMTVQKILRTPVRCVLVSTVFACITHGKHYKHVCIKGQSSLVDILGYKTAWVRDCGYKVGEEGESAGPGKVI